MTVFIRNVLIVISLKTVKYLVRKFRIVEAQIRLTLLHIISINIDSLRNKFEMLQEVIGNNIDILLISETKLDASFPSCQFILDRFTPPYRLDRRHHGGGIMLFVREDIPSKLLNGDTSVRRNQVNFVVYW